MDKQNIPISFINHILKTALERYVTIDRPVIRGLKRYTNKSTDNISNHDIDSIAAVIFDYLKETYEIVGEKEKDRDHYTRTSTIIKTNSGYCFELYYSSSFSKKSAVCGWSISKAECDKHISRK